jgi:uncharacterized delta-60 repeat protein
MSACRNSRARQSRAVPGTIRQDARVNPSLVRANVEVLEDRRMLSAAAGDLDPTFGAGGVATARVPNQDNIEFSGVDTRNGTTVVTGRLGLGEDPHPMIVVARFDDQGRLDPTFDGDGLLISDVLGAVSDVFIQADNKVLVTGLIQDEQRTFPPAVLRFNADGSVDTSFGGTGTGEARLPGLARVGSVRTMPDGRIVLAGTGAVFYGEGNGPYPTTAAARLLPDGRPDTTFSGDGFA